MGSRITTLALPFYAALVVVAGVISALTGTELRLGADSVPLALAVGVVTAAGTVLSGVVGYRTLPVVREVSDELAAVVLQGTSPAGLVLISLLSAVGEEVLFRGVLLPLLGVVISSVIFGLLHVGPDRRYLLWTVWAVAVGFLFAGLYEWTGGLLAPVVAHALHNATTLLLWRRRWTGEKTEGSA